MEFLKFENDIEERGHRTLAQAARAAVDSRHASAAVAPVLNELRTASGFVVKSIHEKPTNAGLAATDWLWQDRLLAGTFSMLVAKPKVGKSTFARHLAWSVACGKPFLGGAVQKGKVAYLALEERPQDLHASFAALGLSGSEEIRYAVAATVESAIEHVTEFRPTLLVADPLFLLLHVKDENAYADMYRAVGPLINVARATGTHILGLHHSPKISKRETIDLALGSTALGAAVSALLVMRKVGEKRTLESVQRIGPNLMETFLGFDPTARRFDLGQARSLDEEARRGQAMVETLDPDAALTEPEIRSRVVGRTTEKAKTLRKLISEGAIEREGSGRRGDPYRYRISRSLVPASKKK